VLRVLVQARPNALCSGRWTPPIPRSIAGSRTHSLARATVAASRSRAPSRTVLVPPASPGPEAWTMSQATAYIAGVGARWPAVVTRSRWRTSRATSRRAASRTSTVAASAGSAWRTCCREHDRDAQCRGRGRASGRHAQARRGALRTAVAHRLQGQGASRQDRAPPGSAWYAAARRLARTARPTSESGPSRTIRAAGSSPTGAASSASNAGVVTGLPRSPDKWVPVTSRQSRAQPSPGSDSPGQAPGQHGHPGQPGVDERAAAHGRPDRRRRAGPDRWRG
jgi:hypothetical protein